MNLGPVRVVQLVQREARVQGIAESQVIDGLVNGFFDQ
jgi:hypothetical protein